MQVETILAQGGFGLWTVAAKVLNLNGMAPGNLADRNTNDSRQSFPL
jgi:hypothetical protein